MDIIIIIIIIITDGTRKRLCTSPRSQCLHPRNLQDARALYTYGKTNLYIVSKIKAVLMIIAEFMLRHFLVSCKLERK